MYAHFADRLLDAISEKRNPSCVGLDPRVTGIPKHIREKATRYHGRNLEALANAIIDFNTQLIDAIYDIVPAVKPQMAFYEQYGHHGVRAFEETINYARDRGLIVIEDAKRNDIGSTAEAYADGHLGEVELLDGSKTPIHDVDAITVNPYLGIDGVAPFIETCKEYGKGIFILDKTSNPSAGELQDKLVVPERWQTDQIEVALEAVDMNIFPQKVSRDQVPIYMLVAAFINKWGQALIGSKGYSSVGAVVGATYPIEANVLRKIMPTAFFLVPGYGAQGATAEDVVFSFDKGGCGAIVNSSRGTIFAYQKEPYRNEYGPTKFADASRAAALDMKEDMIRALESADKLSW